MRIAIDRIAGLVARPARAVSAAFVCLVGLCTPSLARDAIDEGFEAAQWALLSSAGNALQQLGLRAAAGSPDLAALVRKRQDLMALANQAEAALAAAASQPGGETRMVGLRGEIDSLHAEIGEIDARLKQDFPRYAELANPAPMSIADVQALLQPDEGLLLALSGRDHVFVWAIGKTASAWTRAVYGAGVLADDVAALRAQLDPNAATRGAASLARPDGEGPRVPAFDRVRAQLLWFELVRPVEQALVDAKHVFVVADGPLAGLPLSVLVASEPKGADTDPKALRETDWLARRYAFTTLPSVDSLRVIRAFPPLRGEGPRVAFRGYGAPVLGGERPGVQVADAGGSFFRGSLADVEAVRDLAPLPQTGPELKRLAGVLGAADVDVRLGADATETAVKQADLASADVLAFATHGLLSGDLKGLAEPALVLTPPEFATPTDDGLLTASEVAELKLSADWVILSACNTAGSDGRPDAEGLSGLARAFLYAGARAILVSHWPVRDDAAARLTTGTLAALRAADGRLRRSEALRQAMLSLMQDESDPSLAHPSAWAPFVIVGEGGY